MDLRDFVVEVRDVNLRRLGQITPRDLDFRGVTNHLRPGEWTARLPSDHPMAAPLLRPGAGIVVTHRDPAHGVLLSGPVQQPTDAADRDDPAGTLSVVGVTDDVVLWNRLVYPTPTAESWAQTDAYYVVTRSDAESALRDLVNVNAGPGAIASRRVATLSLAPNLQRGVGVSRSCRFDTLGEALADIATLAGLGFRVVQVGAGLQFQVTDPGDRSAFVRLDLLNGTLSSRTVTSTPPTLTRAIVAGQGQGDQRTILERSAPALEAAYGPFGRRERFLDQRQTDDPTELQQAGDKALLEGVGSASVTAVPSDDQTMRWPEDWGVGDTVAVVSSGGVEERSQVTSVILRADKAGVRVGASLGELSTWTPTAKVERAVQSVSQRVSALERTAEVEQGGLPMYLVRTLSTRPTGAERFTGVQVFETDTGRVVTWTGTQWLKVGGRFRTDVAGVAGVAVQPGGTATVAGPFSIHLNEACDVRIRLDASVAPQSSGVVAGYAILMVNGAQQVTRRFHTNAATMTPVDASCEARVYLGTGSHQIHVLLTLDAGSSVAASHATGGNLRVEY